MPSALNPTSCPRSSASERLSSRWGNPEAAIPHLLRARDLRPDDALVHLNLTQAYLALRQYEPARRAYETLLALDAGLARAIEPTSFHAGL